MSRNFARYEQFLRIFALLDILAGSRQQLDDQTLIRVLKERLGLSALSARTLHRDCEFLVACGYPISRAPLPGDRKSGWLLDKEASASRRLPAEPATILELVAFNVARELLRTFEGTILWTGIESLRHKLERGLPEELTRQVEEARRIFHVEDVADGRYSSRPRLLSALSTAITDSREIEIVERAAPDVRPAPQRLHPAMLVIRIPKVQLLAWPADAPETGRPLLIDVERIDRVTALDSTFTPRPVDPARLLDGQG
jgi:predicted DNA-binding transcriptional regulator YafY